MFSKYPEERKTHPILCVDINSFFVDKFQGPRQIPTPRHEKDLKPFLFESFHPTAVTLCSTSPCAEKCKCQLFCSS
jgi:hypothetical protein